MAYRRKLQLQDAAFLRGVAIEMVGTLHPAQSGSKVERTAAQLEELAGAIEASLEKPQETAKSV